MNVVLIEADQLSAKWLGCYGNPAVHTPNLDKLAANSSRFDNCFANNPVCMPSRASTITGRSCQHHGVLYNGWELGLEYPTFSQVLQKNDIQTFGAGKFHLECHANGAFLDVAKYGFDKAVTTEDIRVGEWLEWIKESHPDYYEAALSTCWPIGVNEYGPDKINLTKQIEQIRSKIIPGSQLEILAHSSKVPEELCQTTWITDNALKFISDRDKSKAFFLKVSYVDPHDYYDPPSRFLNLINSDLIPEPLPGEDLATPFRKIPFVDCNTFSPEDWKTIRHYYFASIAFIDEQVGRLLKYLKENGLDNDTAVIFTSDHGDMMGDHNLPTKGAWHYDACIRIPLIVHIPGQAAGKVECQAVSNLDIFQTVTALAGVEHDIAVEGADLSSGNWKKRQDAVLVETYGSYGNTSPEKRARTVANGEYRYTRMGSGQEILFDLQNDPLECKNQALSDEYQEVLSQLRETMLDLTAAQYIPLPSRNKHPFGLH